MPIVFVAFWLLRPHGGLNWRDAALCVIWPAIYFAYAFARGAIDGWYAYWFLDPANLDLLTLVRNAVILVVAFGVAGLALIGLDRLMARRRVS